MDFSKFFFARVGGHIFIAYVETPDCWKEFTYIYSDFSKIDKKWGDFEGFSPPGVDHIRLRIFPLKIMYFGQGNRPPCGWVI